MTPQEAIGLRIGEVVEVTWPKSHPSASPPKPERAGWSPQPEERDTIPTRSPGTNRRRVALIIMVLVA